MVFKKGQAATEYLIILAVVVIIALIVVGVMGGFPGMTQGVSQKDSAAYWATADVGIIQYSISNNTNNLIVLRNNKMYTVRVDTVFVNGTNLLASPVTMAPGASSNFSWASGTFSCVTTGSTYSYKVNIGYTDPQYSTAYNITGEKPLVGHCN